MSDSAGDRLGQPSSRDSDVPDSASDRLGHPATSDSDVSDAANSILSHAVAFVSDVTDSASDALDQLAVADSDLLFPDSADHGLTQSTTTDSAPEQLKESEPAAQHYLVTLVKSSVIEDLTGNADSGLGSLKSETNSPKATDTSDKELQRESEPLLFASDIFSASHAKTIVQSELFLSSDEDDPIFGTKKNEAEPLVPPQTANFSSIVSDNSATALRLPSSSESLPGLPSVLSPLKVCNDLPQVVSDSDSDGLFTSSTSHTIVSNAPARGNSASSHIPVQTNVKSATPAGAVNPVRPTERNATLTAPPSKSLGASLFDDDDSDDGLFSDTAKQGNLYNTCNPYAQNS